MEVVEVAASVTGGGGVRFRNVKGEYLSEDLDWNNVATTEQIFTAVKQGEFQAFKSPRGDYLSLNHDGSLEMVAVATTQTQPQPQPGCQADWSEFNEKCYKFFSEQKNWDDAKTDCENEGVRRTLTSINYNNQFPGKFGFHQLS